MDIFEGFARGYSNLREGLRADRESRNTDWGAITNQLGRRLNGGQPSIAEQQHINALKRTNELCTRLQAATTDSSRQAAIRRFRTDSMADLHDLARRTGKNLVVTGAAWPQLREIAPICRAKGYNVGGPRT